MTYNKLQSILPNDEIHYISDSTQFFIDNQIKSKQFKNNTFILFEYTIDYIDFTIEQLNKVHKNLELKKSRDEKFGLATIRIPIKPTKIAKNLTKVSFSFKKIGANTATQIGTENSNANNWDNGM